MQSLADAKAIFATKPVIENPQVAQMLQTGNHHPTEQLAALRGVADKMTVFQISWTSTVIPAERSESRNR